MAQTHKFIEPLRIEVITRNLRNPDEPASRKVIDHNDHGSRVWLGKHAYWAMRNGYSITTSPVEEGN